MLKGKEYVSLQRSPPPALPRPAVCSTWLLVAGFQGHSPRKLWLSFLLSLPSDGETQRLAPGPVPRHHKGAIVLELVFFPLGLYPCTCWYHRVQLFEGSESGSLCARSESVKTKHSDKFKHGDTYLFPKEREEILDAFCSFGENRAEADRGPRRGSHTWAGCHLTHSSPRFSDLWLAAPFKVK